MLARAPTQDAGAPKLFTQQQIAYRGREQPERGNVLLNVNKHHGENIERGLVPDFCL